MQNLGKNKQTHPTPPLMEEMGQTKDRVFNRFFMEHSALQEALKSRYPDFSIMPLEEAGIAARLAFQQQEFGYDEILQRIRGTMDLLLTAMQDTPDWTERLKYRFMIDVQMELQRFYSWMQAFGPSVTKAS